MAGHTNYFRYLICLIVFGQMLLAVNKAHAAGDVVDASTLQGKVMCGYQGWFETPNDGGGRGWVHWGRSPLGDGDFTVDLLPDVSEFDADELCDTNVKLPNGSPLRLFSSNNPKTVARHFQWMQQYGIDGVYLQRFVSGIGKPVVMKHYDKIVENVRAGAAKYGRAWGMMYDLSGLREGNYQSVIDDWKKLAGVDHITADKQYIRDHGHPVVVLWGLGFGGNGKRPNLFEDGVKLIDFLKNDPVYGGNTVMIGVPHQWSSSLKKGDAYAAGLERVCLAADIIQPWAVGSCRTPEEAVQNAETKWVSDLAWCQSHDRRFMPVVFPGFSWHNLRKGATPSDAIPRLGGKLLWAQYAEARKLNIPMVYEAMFDEVDEGTAILKTTSDVPAPAKSVFVTNHEVPGDFYLKLVGEATRMIRGEITPDQESLISKN